MQKTILAENVHRQTVGLIKEKKLSRQLEKRKHLFSRRVT